MARNKRNRVGLERSGVGKSRDDGLHRDRIVRDDGLPRDSIVRDDRLPRVGINN